MRHRRNTAARRRVRARPEVQALEGRDVPTVIVSAPPTAGPVPASYLLNPIPPGPLEVHIHPHLTVFIDGQPHTVPALVGYVAGPAGGWDPLHTHDDSGTIHVESTVPYAFTLGNFFTVWGQQLSKNDLLGHTGGRVTMTVNGRPSRALGALVLRDHQQIVLREVTTAPHGRHG